MDLKGKPVSVYPVAAGPGQQKASMIVDSAIVFAIRLRCQTPAPETANPVGLCECPPLQMGQTGVSQQPLLTASIQILE